MRNLLVKEWLTLDGVFDAANMDHWWIPYESVERQNQIKEVMLGCDAYVLGQHACTILVCSEKR